MVRRSAAIPDAGSGPAIPDAGSGPAIPDAGSGPAIPDAGSGPAIPDAGSGPAIARAGSGPAIARAGSGPAIARAGSGPAIARAGSGPAIAHAGSGPAIAHAGSGPAIIAAVLLSIAPACGGDEDQPVVGTSSAASSSSSASSGGGSPPAAGCPPGELGINGEGCVPAGIAADGCGEGFSPTADGACDPVLPAQPCDPGAIGRLGESSCAELASCGAAPWGDIPVGATTRYVDAAYPGADSDGTAAKPWRTIGEAVDAADAGDQVAIAAGLYAEALVLDRPVTLWGRCPALVEVVGPDSPPRAITVKPTASGTEIHGLAVTGPALGIWVDEAHDVRVDATWVHDTGYRSIEVDAGGDATITNVLLERMADVGLFSSGGTVVFEDSEIRAPLDGSWTWDVLVEDEATLTMRRSVVSDGRGLGVAVTGAKATLDSVLVRDVIPFSLGGDPPSGYGLGVTGGNGIPRADVTVRRSVIERAANAGVRIESADVLVEDTVVRDTQPAAAAGFGFGVEVVSWPDERAVATLRRAVVERNRMAGVVVAGADAIVEGSIVRDTQPGESAEAGRGIVAQKDPSVPDGAATLTLRGTVVERSYEVGLYVSQSSADLESTAIRDTFPAADDGEFGRGISVVAVVPAKAGEGDLTVRWSVVERCYEVGIGFNGAHLVVEDSVIRDIAPGAAYGNLGDGITLVESGQGTMASILRSRIEAPARAGIAAFGSDVSLAATTIECAPIALHAEPIADDLATFEDLGANACGCAGVPATCTVESTHIEAPTPLP